MAGITICADKDEQAGFVGERRRSAYSESQYYRQRAKSPGHTSIVMQRLDFFSLPICHHNFFWSTLPVTFTELARMLDVLQDFRFCCRELRKKPGLALIAVVSLTLGIG